MEENFSSVWFVSEISIFPRWLGVALRHPRVSQLFGSVTGYGGTFGFASYLGVSVV